MKSKNINQLVAAGALCGIGIVVPMLMPKIVIGPMSFTLASHVAIFMAMFISPKLAAAVCLGMTLGFFMTTPVIITLRAASHIVFCSVGSAAHQKDAGDHRKAVSRHHVQRRYGPGACCGRSGCRVAFFLAGSIFKPKHLADGYVMSVLVLVGVGTFLHSLIDYTISIMLWKPVRAALPSLAELRE